jgi:hypothetical protein
LYLDGNEPNYEGQENCLFSIPALFAIDFYFAFQFPSLPTILHENLEQRQQTTLMFHGPHIPFPNTKIRGRGNNATVAPPLSAILTPPT